MGVDYYLYVSRIYKWVDSVGKCHQTEKNIESIGIYAEDQDEDETDDEYEKRKCKQYSKVLIRDGKLLTNVKFTEFLASVPVDRRDTVQVWDYAVMNPR